MEVPGSWGWHRVRKRPPCPISSFINDFLCVAFVGLKSPVAMSTFPSFWVSNGIPNFVQPMDGSCPSTASMSESRVTNRMSFSKATPVLTRVLSPSQGVEMCLHPHLVAAVSPGNVRQDYKSQLHLVQLGMFLPLCICTFVPLEPTGACLSFREFFSLPMQLVLWEMIFFLMRGGAASRSCDPSDVVLSFSLQGRKSLLRLVCVGMFLPLCFSTIVPTEPTGACQPSEVDGGVTLRMSLVSQGGFSSSPSNGLRSDQQISSSSFTVPPSDVSAPSFLQVDRVCSTWTTGMFYPCVFTQLFLRSPTWMAPSCSNGCAEIHLASSASCSA